MCECDLCKYYQKEDDSCLFSYMGNGDVRYAPCYKEERTAKAEYSNIDGEYLCKACGRVVQIEDAYCCGCGARLEWNEPC